MTAPSLDSEPSEPSVRPSVHRFFSFDRVQALASNTLLQLVRLKIFYFLVIFGVAVIGSSSFFEKLTFQGQFQALKDTGLGAMSIFTWLLATLSAAMLIPKDLEDRTLYTILAKPVPRFEYLLGKLLGVLSMLAIATVAMSIVFAIVLSIREQAAIAEATATITEDQLPATLAEIRAGGWNANLIIGIFLVFLKSAIIASLTLLLSTFATSSLFTILMSIACYFIGHIQHIAREFALEKSGLVGPVQTLFFLVTSVVFPDLHLFSVVDDIAGGTAVPMAMLFKTTSLGFGYLFIYSLVAYVLFSNKEL